MSHAVYCIGSSVNGVDLSWAVFICATSRQPMRVALLSFNVNRRTYNLILQNQL